MASPFGTPWFAAMASPAPSSAGRQTPLRARRVVREDGVAEEPLEPSSVSLLRKRALLRSFGKNYLTGAHHPGKRK